MGRYPVPMLTHFVAIVVVVVIQNLPEFGRCVGAGQVRFRFFQFKILDSNIVRIEPVGGLYSRAAAAYHLGRYCTLIVRQRGAREREADR